MGRTKNLRVYDSNIRANGLTVTPGTVPDNTPENVTAVGLNV